MSKKFVPFHEDPDPKLPVHYIKALARVLGQRGHRSTRQLSSKAKTHARPYVRWARELLAKEED